MHCFYSFYLFPVFFSLWKVVIVVALAVVIIWIIQGRICYVLMKYYKEAILLEIAFKRLVILVKTLLLNSSSMNALFVRKIFFLLSNSFHPPFILPVLQLIIHYQCEHIWQSLK